MLSDGWIGERGAPSPFGMEAPDRGTKGESNLINLGQFFDHFLFIAQSLDVHDPKGLAGDKGGFLTGQSLLVLRSMRFRSSELTFP